MIHQLLNRLSIRTLLCCIIIIFVYQNNLNVNGQDEQQSPFLEGDSLDIVNNDNNSTITSIISDETDSLDRIFLIDEDDLTIQSTFNDTIPVLLQDVINFYSTINNKTSIGNEGNTSTALIDPNQIKNNSLDFISRLIDIFHQEIQVQNTLSRIVLNRTLSICPQCIANITDVVDTLKDSTKTILNDDWLLGVDTLIETLRNDTLSSSLPQHIEKCEPILIIRETTNGNNNNNNNNPKQTTKKDDFSLENYNLPPGITVPGDKNFNNGTITETTTVEVTVGGGGGGLITGLLSAFINIIGNLI